MNEHQDRNAREDTFDRIYGSMHGLPDHEWSRPTTVTSALPMIGRTQTYVLQTVRTPEGGNVGFLQMVDAEGRARIVIPEKVMAALFRHREQLMKRGQRERGRDQMAARKQRRDELNARAFAGEPLSDEERAEVGRLMRLTAPPRRLRKVGG